MNKWWTSYHKWQGYVAAILLVGASTAVRLGLLGGLESRATYVTFSPAVMIAALYGGLFPGLLATVLSALLADYFLIEPMGFGIRDSADWLGLGVFLMSCAMISGICEAMHRARIRAAQAEVQARFAEERRLMDEALRASEENYRELVQSANSIIMRWKPDGEITFFNKFAQSFFGYSESEVLGQSAKILIPPRDSLGQDMSRMVSDIARNPDAFASNENENIRRDGERVWVRWTNRAVLDDAGKVREILAIGNDVTDRRRAEEQQRRSLAKQTALLKATMEILEQHSLEDLLQVIAKAAREITEAKLSVTGHGYVNGKFRVGAASRAEDIPPCPQNKVFAIEKGGVYMEVIRRVQSFRLADDEMRSHTEWWGLPEDHVPLRGLMASRLIGKDGSPSGMILVSYKNEGEFTEESETALNQLAGIASLALRHIEARESIERQNSILQGINRIFRETLTCDTEEELGRTCLAVAEEQTKSKFGFIGQVSPEGRLDDIAISDPGWSVCRMKPPVGHGKRVPIGFTIHGVYGRVIRDRKGFFTNDPSAHPDRIGTPEGHPPLTAFLGVPLIQAGTVVGMIGLGNREGGYTAAELETLEILGVAIIEALMRKRAEAALRQAKDELELRVQERTAELKNANEELVRSNDDLERFAYISSHDLQEPLRMVASFVQLLEKKCRDKLNPEETEYIKFAVEGAHRMSTLIRDLLAYSRVNTRAQPPDRVNCEILLDTVLLNLRLRISETGARITHDLLPILMADEGQLTQVFQNLIGNAIKFRHPDRPPEVHIRAEEKENEWLFSVRDNGIGIEKQFFDRIFVIFQRLHANREKFPGTGIGLAIVKRIVERQGGRIWVDSAPGEGSTFYFTLSKGGHLR